VPENGRLDGATRHDGSRRPKKISGRRQKSQGYASVSISGSGDRRRLSAIGAAGQEAVRAGWRHTH